MGKQTAYPQDNRLAPIASTAIIQFGILCCVITMVIVMAVAVMAR